MATLKDLALKYKYTKDPHFLHIIYLRLDPFIKYHTWDCFFKNGLPAPYLPELYQCACVGTYLAISKEVHVNRDHKFIYMDIRRGLRKYIGKYLTNEFNYKKRLTKEPNARRIDHHIRSRFPTSEEIETNIDAGIIRSWLIWKMYARDMSAGVWAYYDCYFVTCRKLYKDDGGYGAYKLKGTKVQDKIDFLALVDEARKHFLTEQEYADYAEHRDQQERSKNRRAYKGLSAKYRGVGSKGIK